MTISTLIVRTLYILRLFFSIFQVVSLGVFLILVIGKTVYLKKRFKINALKLRIKKDHGLKHTIELVSFLIVSAWTFLLLFSALDSAFGTFPGLNSIILFENLYVKSIGVLLVLIAFIIFIWALKDLGVSWRLGIDENNPGKLITKGIYSFFRHPIYVFFDLYFIGIFLINGNIIFLIFTFLIVVIMHYQALAEEYFLSEKFGNKYKDYIDEVGRYFTFKKLRKMFSQKKYPGDNLLEEKQ